MPGHRDWAVDGSHSQHVEAEAGKTQAVFLQDRELASSISSIPLVLMGRTLL